MNEEILRRSGSLNPHSVTRHVPLLAALVMLLCATGALAQTTDLWFGCLNNYEDSTGKYINLYVTSTVQTNIYVDMVNQATKVLPVQPYSVAAFNIPITWEVKTSGILEHKGLHIWSTEGTISAYVMSHNPYTSDGTAIIPPRAWGREYVVAAYNGLYGDTSKRDYPSEFLIVADQDNTVCTITPTADIRQESAPHLSPNIVLHRKGVPFVEILNKGDVIQYKTTLVKNATDYDLTGTYIRSNYAIGLVAGAQCTNVPSNFTTPSHLCEMIPPVRLWSKQYYSVPFYPANPGKQWSTFLVIGTQPNQIIRRLDPSGPEHVECVFSKKYDHHYSDSIDQCSRWTSDAPFLLVQYVVGSTYPDSINGEGAPSEVIVSPVEQWSKRVVFQTPVSIGSVSPYRNYVNILVRNSAMNSTKFENQGIANFTHLQIDSLYSVYRVSGVKAGAHSVVSDSNVGVYIYGYGQDEAYAWGEPISALSVPPDTATLPADTVTADVAPPHAQTPTAHATLTLSADGRTAHANIPPDWTQPFALVIENLLGTKVLSLSGASVPHDFDLRALPNGAYIYRLSSGTESAVGKLVIQR